MAILSIPETWVTIVPRGKIMGVITAVIIVVAAIAGVWMIAQPSKEKPGQPGGGPPVAPEALYVAGTW